MTTITWEKFKPDTGYIFRYYFNNIELLFEGFEADIIINSHVIELDMKTDDSGIMFYDNWYAELNDFDTNYITMYDVMKRCIKHVL